jgi:hypothetical protein
MWRSRSTPGWSTSWPRAAGGKAAAADDGDQLDDGEQFEKLQKERVMGDLLDFGNVYPSVLNWMLVGIMAVTFIATFKFLMARYRVPGVSDVFASI